MEVEAEADAKVEVEEEAKVEGCVAILLQAVKASRHLPRVVLVCFRCGNHALGRTRRKLS